MPPSQPRYDTGVIHGRFQVLHNDHLRYLLAGRALCRHLVVGITNPDPSQVRPERADPDRSDSLANPLTYYERTRLVQAALIGADVDPGTFSIVPLPINFPERYRYYVPMEAVFFLSIYDEWGRRKRKYFETLGLNLHVLWEVSPQQKGLSASHIRRRMLDGQPWEHMVPCSVAPLLREWNLAARLHTIQRGAT